MPELPEVESVRRSLVPIIGARVLRVDIHRADIVGLAKLKRATTRPTGTTRTRGLNLPASELAQGLLMGRTITGVKRRGKVLLLTTDAHCGLAIHLGMTGELALEVSTPQQASALKPHTHVVWTLDAPRSDQAPATTGTPPSPALTLAFRDPRRFGGVLIVPDASGLNPACWTDLGPDAFETDPVTLAEHLAHAGRSSRRCVKALLLDQGTLAGVGNIYADEACFRAGVPPRALCTSLKARHWHALAHAVHEVMTAAINAGGSTVRSYVNAAGQAGQFALQHAVYARAGQPCTRCDTILRGTTLAGRTTVWCSKCQRLQRPGERT